MHSKLFSRFDPKHEDNKEFVQALSEILSLTEDQWKSIVAMIPTLFGMRTRDEALPYVEKLETETKLTRPTLARVINFATFILSTLQDEDMADEDPKLWTKDLISFGILPSAGEERFSQYMVTLRDSAFSKMDTISRERSTESGVLPAFTGVSTTVELRGVFKKPYKLGSNIEDYTPELDRAQLSGPLMS